MNDPALTLWTIIRELLLSHAKNIHLLSTTCSVSDLYRGLDYPPEYDDRFDLVSRYKLIPTNQAREIQGSLADEIESALSQFRLPDSLMEHLWSYPFYRALIELPLLADHTLVTNVNLVTEDAIKYGLLWSEDLFTKMPHTLKHKESMLRNWHDFGINIQKLSST